MFNRAFCYTNSTNCCCYYSISSLVEFCQLNDSHLILDVYEFEKLQSLEFVMFTFVDTSMEFCLFYFKNLFMLFSYKLAFIIPLKLWLWHTRLFYAAKCFFVQ